MVEGDLGFSGDVFVGPRGLRGGHRAVVAVDGLHAMASTSSVREVGERPGWAGPNALCSLMAE